MVKYVVRDSGTEAQVLWSHNEKGGLFRKHPKAGKKWKAKGEGNYRA